MSQLLEADQKFGSVLTITGENCELNAKIHHKTIEFTHIAVGNANDVYVQPSRTQTTLVNEIARIPVTGMEKIVPSAENGIPQMKVWAKIPDDIVDVAIREFAVVATFNGYTYLHAIGNTPRIPILSSANNGGEVNDIYIEMTFAVTSVDQVVMIDPNIVTATRAYVDTQDQAHEEKADPHPQYATDQDLLDHINAKNPHPQYATILKTLSYGGILLIGFILLICQWILARVAMDFRVS
ncbi:phage tail protein [Vibrio sp. PP-XX7]